MHLPPKRHALTSLLSKVLQFNVHRMDEVKPAGIFQFSLVEELIQQNEVLKWYFITS